MEAIFEKAICSKGKEKQSCMMYLVGKCCDEFDKSVALAEEIMVERKEVLIALRDA